GSTKSLFVINGFIGLVIFLVLGSWFLPWFKIGQQSQSHILIVFLLAGLTFFVSSVNSIYYLVLGALQRYDIITKIGMLQVVLLNFGVLAAVIFGYKLKVIMLITLAVNLLLMQLFKKRARSLLGNWPIKIS